MHRSLLICLLSKICGPLVLPGHVPSSLRLWLSELDVKHGKVAAALALGQNAVLLSWPHA